MDLGRWFPASLPQPKHESMMDPEQESGVRGVQGKLRHDISHMKLDDISETKSEIEPFRKSRPGITDSKSNFHFLEKNILKNILQLIPCTKFLRMFSCITSGYFLAKRWTSLEGGNLMKGRPILKRGVSILPATRLSVRSDFWGKRFSLDAEDLSYIPVNAVHTPPHPIPSDKGSHTQI